MSKKFFCVLSLLSLFINHYSQTSNGTVAPCGTYQAMEDEFNKNPESRKLFNSIQSQLTIEYQKALKKYHAAAKMASPVYTIPVVFHIMGPQNISNQTIINLVKYINNDFSKLGNDVSTISPLFSNLYNDSEIRFQLAKKDPNGNCTNGIIKHPNESINWSQTAPSYNYSGVGLNRWPTTSYLNIYVVACISSSSYPCPSTGGIQIAGYTYKPGALKWPATNNIRDAIVLLSSSLGQSNSTASRILSHEIGHWLNLDHTFGGINSTGSACGDDGVDDTPITKGTQSCPSSIGTNTCDVSTNQNVENIMDYSTCRKMFTQGQILKMRVALENDTAGRKNLWTAANLLYTGIVSTNICLPGVDFISNKAIGCQSNNPVIYTNTSQLGGVGNISWSFEGGTPSTSTLNVQEVVYASSGSFSVGLTASNTWGSNAIGKFSYANILDDSKRILLPHAIDFENPVLPTDVKVGNWNLNSPTWVLNNLNGANITSNSIFMDNASSKYTANHIDVFETPVYDFSSMSNISLSYYYAYAKRTINHADTFRIQYSFDCGATWNYVLGVESTSQMALKSGGVDTIPFIPATNQWVNNSISPLLLTVFNNRPRVKFRFYFRADSKVGQSNNMYIDQINLTGLMGIGISEFEKTIQLSMYPNPTNTSSLVDFKTDNGKTAIISVTDLSGRVLESSNVLKEVNGHITYTINESKKLAQGVYIVVINTQDRIISKKLMIN